MQHSQSRDFRCPRLLPAWVSSTPAATLQEIGAKSQLECSNLLAQRGLADVQALGRLRETQAMRDFDEITELPQVHGLRSRSAVGFDVPNALD